MQRFQPEPVGYKVTGKPIEKLLVGWRICGPKIVEWFDNPESEILTTRFDWPGRAPAPGSPAQSASGRS